MGKRKREAAESADGRDSAHGIPSTQLAVQITNGKANLARTLEQAQQYERQKLGTKQRDPIEGTNGGQVAAEIQALKALNMTSVADRRLNKALIKTKSIVNTGLLPAEVTSPSASGTMDTATANVTARLFKHREVAEAFEAAMSSVRKFLGVKDGSKNALKRARQTEEKEEPAKKKVKKESVTEGELPSKRVKKEHMDVKNLDDRLQPNSHKAVTGVEGDHQDKKLSKKALRDQRRAEKHKEKLAVGQTLPAKSIKKESNTGDDVTAAEFNDSVDGRFTLSTEDTTTKHKDRTLAATAKSSAQEDVVIGSFFESSHGKEMLASGSAAKNRLPKHVIDINDISESDEINDNHESWSEPGSEDEMGGLNGVDDPKLLEHDGEEPDYDSEDLAMFDDRLASDDDDDHDLDVMAERTNLANLLKEQLVTSNSTASKQVPDGTSTGEDKVLISKKLLTLDKALDASSMALETRQQKNPAVARRMILGHLGIRDPLKPKRQPGNGSASASENDAFAGATLSTLPVDGSTGQALESVSNEPVVGMTIGELAALSESESYHTPPEQKVSIAIMSSKTPSLGASRTDKLKPIVTEQLPAPDDSTSHSSSVSSSASASESSSESELDVAPAFNNNSAKSAFLPSLTAVGYWSGSEEATDIEEEIAPRKNRRGQRARQQIWEKKFKEKAKHLKKVAARKGRDEGWDLQRGATLKDDGNSKGRVKPNWRQKGPTGANEAPLGDKKGKPKHKDNEGALHPSWEAKKNSKDKAVGIGAFKGKKITFD